MSLRNRIIQVLNNEGLLKSDSKFLFKEQLGDDNAVADMYTRSKYEDKAKEERQKQLEQNFDQKFITINIPPNTKNVKQLVVPKGSQIQYVQESDNLREMFFKKWLNNPAWEKLVPNENELKSMFPINSAVAFKTPNNETYVVQYKKITDSPPKWVFTWFVNKENDVAYDQRKILGNTEIPEKYKDKWFDNHLFAGILAVATSFIPFIGPYISAVIGLLDAKITLDEGNKTEASLMAIFSLLPMIGPVVSKIPIVRELGIKGMTGIVGKLENGVALTEIENNAIKAINQNSNWIKTEVANTGKLLENLSDSIKNLKPQYIKKFGIQNYENLLRQLFSKEISKEQFIQILNSNIDNSWTFANWSVKGGLKFSEIEIDQLKSISAIAKKGEEGVHQMTLNYKGSNLPIKVNIGHFPDESWNGLQRGDQIWLNLDKVANFSEDEIYQVISHEAAHVKDPSLISPKLNKKYQEIAKANDAAKKEYQQLYSRSMGSNDLNDEILLKSQMKVEDLYSQYYFHPQEIVANNQMVLNNITGQMYKTIGEFGPEEAKKILDKLINYASAKEPLDITTRNLLGSFGSKHLNALYMYNKKYYQNFLKQLVKQSEYLKSQLNLI